MIQHNILQTSYNFLSVYLSTNVSQRQQLQQQHPKESPQHFEADKYETCLEALLAAGDSRLTQPGRVRRSGTSAGAFGAGVVVVHICTILVSSPPGRFTSCSRSD